MLLRFRVSNHRSIKGTQELSMVASSQNDNEGYVIKRGRYRVLPVAVIYGANASGKSNVLDALGFMSKLHISPLRLKSDIDSQQSGVSRDSFALVQNRGDEPSHFEIDFLIDDVRYQYGFEISDSGFEQEWLYSFPNARRRVLFERDKQTFKFGTKLRGQNVVISQLTGPQRSFISSAVENNHQQLKEIYRSIKNIYNLPYLGDFTKYLITGLYQDDFDDNDVLHFLNEIGTGISGFRRDNLIFSSGNELIGNRLLILDKDKKNIMATHNGTNGGVFPLQIEDESMGTRKLLVEMKFVFGAIKRGSSFFLDEIDANVHVQVAQAIIALFTSPKTNPKGAQLICTTHNTTLLHTDPSQPQLLRRDEIWFTEKNEEGATELYPLADFATRAGDNFEKGYLQGRFGAIPFAGSVADLIGRILPDGPK